MPLAEALAALRAADPARALADPDTVDVALIDRALARSAISRRGSLARPTRRRRIARAVALAASVLAGTSALVDGAALALGYRPPLSRAVVRLVEAPSPVVATFKGGLVDVPPDTAPATLTVPGGWTQTADGSFIVDLAGLVRTVRTTTPDGDLFERWDAPCRVPGDSSGGTSTTTCFVLLDHGRHRNDVKPENADLSQIQTGDGGGLWQSPSTGLWYALYAGDAHGAVRVQVRTPVARPVTVDVQHDEYVAFVRSDLADDPLAHGETITGIRADGSRFTILESADRSALPG